MSATISRSWGYGVVLVVVVVVELVLGITSGSVTSMTGAEPLLKRRLGTFTNGTIRNYKSRKGERTSAKERTEEKRGSGSAVGAAVAGSRASWVWRYGEVDEPGRRERRSWKGAIFGGRRERR